MSSVWHTPDLANAIIHSEDVFEQTQSLITDVVTGRIDLTEVVANMGEVLTHTQPEQRVKGMRFYTKILTDVPPSFLNETQIKFISKFYVDRLKDHHSVIPTVIEGYLALINMENYNVMFCGEFLVALFREVTCQSQTRQDRYNIYSIVKRLLEIDDKYISTLGPDFVYGVISSMDGERDPRNLLFLFNFLPMFLKSVPLGHLVEEMFDVISCYYPIDFHPSPDDPAPVTRDDLADALCPCLCAVPEFGEHCLVLLVEKLQSSLRLAKLDSLKLLTESCKTFNTSSYGPFLKTLWSTLYQDLNHKTDDELKMACHITLSALVAKLAIDSETDQSMENLVKSVLVSTSVGMADANTVAQFFSNTKIVLTTANASKQSCLTVAKTMISSAAAYYEFKTTVKLQIACLEFLGDLYNIAKNFDLLEQLKSEIAIIPQTCLTCVSCNTKEFQMAGFKTIIKIKEVLTPELVPPMMDVLIQNVQHSKDNEILRVSVETIHVIARKYPEIIMDIVLKDKFHIGNVNLDKDFLQKRLNLLSNLASIDEFTKVIIQEMLKIITENQTEAPKVIEALSETISLTSVYTPQKLTQIESDHGLIEPVLTWLYQETGTNNLDALAHGYTLVSSTMGSLPPGKQQNILSKHTDEVLEKCTKDDAYFPILECLYAPLHQDVYDPKFEEIIKIALKIALSSDDEMVRTKGCVLIAHLLNKVELGNKFELLYEILKSLLSNCSREDGNLCPKIIHLYGWIVKALLMRNNDRFMFWLEKIVGILKIPLYCKHSADAIRLIMADFPEYLNLKQHCRISILYKQRMFVAFSELIEKVKPTPDTKEMYLLSWAYVLEKTPKSVLINEAVKVAIIAVDALVYDNKELLLVSLDILDHLIKTKITAVGDSLQTILPRMVSLTRYTNSMDVRIKSLECLYDIANTFRTSSLLPHKQDILLDLAPSLDDKKRLVRNMAVHARTRWFLVGAPGEEKPN